MFETVRHALGRTAATKKHYECRDCGTALDRSATECPVCNSSDIAVFEL